MFLPSTHRYSSIPSSIFKAFLRHHSTSPYSQVLRKGTGNDVIVYSLLSGIAFHMANYASFLVLQRLSPVTHAGTLSLFTYTLTLITQQTLHDCIDLHSLSPSSCQHARLLVPLPSWYVRIHHRHHIHYLHDWYTLPMVVMTGMMTMKSLLLLFQTNRSFVLGFQNVNMLSF